MKLRIIVIDDEESIRDTLRWHLEDQGHEVIAFENPEVMSTFGNNCNNREHVCCDFIFVDYNMPWMSGLKFLEHSDNASCKLPKQNKVLMSGSLTRDLAGRAEKMGCSSMQKPISLSKVDDLIEEASARISSERPLATLANMDI